LDLQIIIYIGHLNNLHINPKINKRSERNFLWQLGLTETGCCLSRRTRQPNIKNKLSGVFIRDWLLLAAVGCCWLLKIIMLI
jgi:hypothetical protein